MDLQWLQDFRALADSGNFSRAADQRNTTQSALSRRIQGLENWVGAKLVDRSSYPIQLTPAGRTFLELSSDLLGRLTTARVRARAAEARQDDPIVVATSHTIATDLFPRWVTRVEEFFARVPMRVEYYGIDRAFSALEDGSAQYCVCAADEAPLDRLGQERFLSHIIDFDEMIPVCVPDSNGEPLYRLPGTKDQPLPCLSVAQEGLLESAARRVMAERGQGVTLDVFFESPQKGAVVSMVRGGKGLAWLPRAQITTQLEAGVFVLAGGPEWAVPFEIRLYRSVAPLPDLAERLWKVLDEVMPQRLAAYLAAREAATPQARI